MALIRLPLLLLVLLTFAQPVWPQVSGKFWFNTTIPTTFRGQENDYRNGTAIRAGVRIPANTPFFLWFEVVAPAPANISSVMLGNATRTTVEKIVPYDWIQLGNNSVGPASLPPGNYDFFARVEYNAQFFWFNYTFQVADLTKTASPTVKPTMTASPTASPTSATAKTTSDLPSETGQNIIPEPSAVDPAVIGGIAGGAVGLLVVVACVWAASKRRKQRYRIQLANQYINESKRLPTHSV